MKSILYRDIFFCANSLIAAALSWADHPPVAAQPNGGMAKLRRSPIPNQTIVCAKGRLVGSPILPAPDSFRRNSWHRPRTRKMRRDLRVGWNRLRLGGNASFLLGFRSLDVLPIYLFRILLLFLDRWNAFPAFVFGAPIVLGSFCSGEDNSIRIVVYSK